MSASRITWLSAGRPDEPFPDVSGALREPDGLIAAGGDLTTARLLMAYQQGIFPWYEEGQPILWWSPDPRCIIRPDEFRVSRRLRQQARNSNWELRFNSAFASVIDACAQPRHEGGGTWITADMNEAYQRLHRIGWAHSVEIWRFDELVGGLYGVAIGQVFFGESMFSREKNASKLALWGLTVEMQKSALALLDCQVSSPHLLTLGARKVDRSVFTSDLARYCRSATPWCSTPTDSLPVREF